MNKFILISNIDVMKKGLILVKLAIFFCMKFLLYSLAIDFEIR